MRNVAFIISSLLIWGCAEDITFEATPQIELVSIGPSTLIELQDSIHIVVAYEDGDGDLGENDPEAKNFFIRDERIDLTYEFRIQELVPGGSEVPIRERLELTLPNTVITNGGNSQTVTYRIWVVDRAGHESNRISAGTITVQAP